MTPKTPIATAMASSKLLEAAVNATVVFFSYDRWRRKPRANDTAHMTPK